MKSTKSIFLLLTQVLCIMGCTNQTITGDLVITNVTVIDVEKGIAVPEQTVVVVNENIITITPFSDKDEIAAETMVDGSGKFLMPSLWDMHTHYTTSAAHKGFLNLIVANGVLGVRDLWGDLESRDSIAASNTVAPTIYLSGAIIDGSFTLLQGTMQPDTPSEAVAMVDSLHAKGADFIKVYDDLSFAMYKAIAHRCKELGLPLVGHVPLEVTVVQAAEMGQKSMEHLNGIWKSSTNVVSEIDSLERLFKANFLSGNLTAAIGTFITINGMVNEGFDESATIELAKVLSQNGTFVTPTLTVIDRHWNRKGGTYSTQEQNKYVPDELLQQWDPELNFPDKMFPPPAWENGRKLLETSKKIVKSLNDNGVPLLAGTDCGVSYVVPGFSLHDELQLLVDAGLSNAEALRTATVNPVKYFGISESHGKISPGMQANFVLLDDNPFEHISNTKNISGVVQNGYYRDGESLNALLREAEIH